MIYDNSTCSLIWPFPVLITGKNGNAVLISEEDWNAIQETLYLTSILGMAESLIQGKESSLEDCVNYSDL